MKRVVTSILLLLVVSFSYPILSQQRNVIINTNSVDRTVITTDPNVDIWTQLEQERIAAEKAEQKRIAAEKAEQERIAAEKAEQARIAAEKAEQERIAAEKAEQERVAAEKAEKARIAAEKAEQARIAAEKAEQARIAAEKAEQERIAAKKAEQERIAAKKAEQERIEAENMNSYETITNTKVTSITQENASIEDVKQVHNEIDKLVTQLYWEGFKNSIVFNYYKNIYKSLSRDKENVRLILVIQSVVLQYYQNRANVYTDIEYKLKKTSSLEEEIEVFMSYYTE